MEAFKKIKEHKKKEESRRRERWRCRRRCWKTPSDEGIQKLEEDNNDVKTLVKEVLKRLEEKDDDKDKVKTRTKWRPEDQDLKKKGVGPADKYRG